MGNDSFDDPFFYGLEDACMESTLGEVLNFIEENDVKFIRLAFCDYFGMMKNISVMPGQLERVFHEGISIDGSAIAGFQDVSASDLFLYPDVSTLDILPWRPSNGRVIRFFCEIRYPDGRPYEKDCRSLLKQKLEAIRSCGWQLKSGLECEFYAFDKQQTQTLQPIDTGGYLDIFPKDRGEDLRRDICLMLEEMGIIPESSHHEQGPGQNEIDFHFDDALISCDQYMTFQWIVENVTQAHGVNACFLPKPLKDQSGNGLHFHLSLHHHGKNVYTSEQSATFRHFTAGILAHMQEMTLFLNPVANSYERLGKCEAPSTISWSHNNRSALIRIPAIHGEGRRLELRSPDPCCNVYLASYLLLCAGWEGIDKQLPLPLESRGNLNQPDESLTLLPQSLAQAVEYASKSSFLKAVLPSSLRNDYLNAKATLVKAEN